MSITAWPVGTTKIFTGTVALNSVAQNLTLDTITIRLKQSVGDTDAQAVLSKAADVTTAGATGTYTMTLTPAETASITPGVYYYDISWVRSTGAEYILETGTIELESRVSDA